MATGSLGAGSASQGLCNPLQEVVAACATIGHCLAAVGLYEGSPPAATVKGQALLNLLGVDAAVLSIVLAEGPDSEFDVYLGSWQYVREEGGQPMNATFGDKNLVRIARTFAKYHNGIAEIGTQKVEPDPIVLLAQNVRDLARARRQLLRAPGYHSRRRYRR